ncbi:hypothetical protein [Actinomyces israelii]|uniref:hypothetical protein n=1 Tax=Actinomyces israelii TaxID=1659 RepID=UPI00338F1D2C
MKTSSSNYTLSKRHNIARAVDRRRLGLMTVRRCVALALGRFGAGRPAQVPGSHEEPSWPEGIAGSMTHCKGYRAAAVASSAAVSS